MEVQLENYSHDLAALEYMAAELPDYLRSDVLFWQMQAGNATPKLSLGLLLLTRTRLDAASGHLTPGECVRLEQAGRESEAILNQSPAAAERKAEKELHTRLNLWGTFIDDCLDDDGAGSYRNEITQRVIIALLLRRFPRLIAAPEAKRLSTLDAKLRPHLKSGSFIWQAELQAAFPQSEFWYLYGSW